MPYEVVKDGDAYVCRKKNGGKVFGRHKSKARAMAQMRALYAAEGKAMDVDVTATPAELDSTSPNTDSSGTDPLSTDALIYFGGELKALDDAGKVGGHLVLWGDASTPDATKHKDYFTPETDFWAEWPSSAVILYHHGLDATLGPRRLGSAELKADDAGVWMQGQLKLRDEYERKIFEAIKQGKMGLSSGSVSHLVRRERQVNGAHKLLSWPIFEASITPTPGEPRTCAVALKALIETEAADNELINEITTEGLPGTGHVLAGIFGEAEAAELKAIESAVKRAEIRAGKGRPISGADREAIVSFLAARGDREAQLKALLQGPKLAADAEPQTSADLAALKAKTEAWEAALAAL